MTAGDEANLDFVVSSYVAKGQIVTSLDVSDVETFGATISGPIKGDVYSTVYFQGAPGDLAAWAATQGAAGIVVTAVALREGQQVAYAYGRAGDSNVYETQLMPATPTNLAAPAQVLAQAGYTITAAGRDAADRDSLVLVGTRLRGTTTPRSAMVLSGDPSDSANEQALNGQLLAGAAIVAISFDGTQDHVVLEK